MKRILCVMLVTVMLLTSAVAYGDNVDFEVTFTNLITEALDYDAKDWMGNSYARALLTIAILVDFIQATGLEIGDVYNGSDASFVGREGIALGVWLKGNSDHSYLIIYSPLLGQASYAAQDPVSSSIAELAFSTTFTDGYYKNDQEDLFKALKDLSDLIN